jgi:hypothetical protein
MNPAGSLSQNAALAAEHNCRDTHRQLRVSGPWHERTKLIESAGSGLLARRENWWTDTPQTSRPTIKKKARQ